MLCSEEGIALILLGRPAAGFIARLDRTPVLLAPKHGPVFKYFFGS